MKKRFTEEQIIKVRTTSLPGLRVVRELDRLVQMRGKPQVIISDNGPELTSAAVLI